MSKKELLKLLTEARDMLSNELYQYEMEHGNPFPDCDELGKQVTKGSKLDLFVDKLNKVIKEEEDESK